MCKSVKQFTNSESDPAHLVDWVWWCGYWTLPLINTGYLLIITVHKCDVYENSENIHRITDHILHCLGLNQSR